MANEPRLLADLINQPVRPVTILPPAHPGADPDLEWAREVLDSVPVWYGNLIMDGLSKLILLRLEAAPGADAIVGTAATWIQALPCPSDYSESLDALRLRKAFQLLLRNCQRWPAPRDFLDRIPPRPPTKPAPRDTSPAAIQRGLAGVHAAQTVLAYQSALESISNRPASLFDRLLCHCRRRIYRRLPRMIIL